MIFARTPRLVLRALRHDELPRLVDIIGTWDIARWLVVLPHPYTMADAAELWSDISSHYDNGQPQFFALAAQDDDCLIGGIGLHDPRTPDPEPGEIELGYWLARDHWGQGLMSEAIPAAIHLAFDRAEVALLSSTTLVDNLASQNVLRKAGFAHRGVRTRTYPSLRGGDQVDVWRLTRADYEARLL